MTEGNARHCKQGSTWRLLLQFVPPDGPDSNRESVQRIMEAVRELGLQPGVAKRIEQAVMDALQNETERRERAQHHSAVSIRILLSGLSSAEPLRPDSVTQRVRSQEGSGWEFFLLERQAGTPPSTQVESPRVIELYLYQETARVK
jgi:hypothetical protein